jgi:phosphate-selective porin
MRWNRRPEIRRGSDLEIDVRLKLQGNIRRMEGDGIQSSDYAEVRRSRAGVEGRFLRHYEYQFEVELDNRASWFRDGYLNYRRLSWLQVQGGRFKIPFGRDQLTPLTQLDFIFRSRIGAQLAPARETGVQAHGRVLNRILAYQAGIFRNDGEMSWTAERNPTAGLTTAARVIFTPSEAIELPDIVKSLDAGVAFTRSETDGPSLSVRARTGPEDTFFPRIPISGLRTRRGAEAVWTPGSFAVQAETIRVREQRKAQSVFGDDLPDLLSSGWYVQGAWIVTGENKRTGRLSPSKPLFSGGAGAFEIAGRREYIGFRSDAAQGTPSRSPRAANIFPSGLHGWTAGVNWYPTENFKFQFNFIRDRIVPFSGASAEPYSRRVYILALQVVL